MTVSCQTITLATCDAYLVSPAMIYTHRRTHAFVEPRHVSWQLARDMTTHSLPEIGRLMGGYHHTTVLYGCRTISAQMRQDQELRERYDNLRRLILSYAEEKAMGLWPAPGEWVLETAMLRANETGEPQPMAGSVAQAMVAGLMHYVARSRALERANVELRWRLNEIGETVTLLDPADREKLDAAARVATAWQHLQARRFTPFERVAQTALENALKDLSPLFAKTGEHA